MNPKGGSASRTGRTRFYSSFTAVSQFPHLRPVQQDNRRRRSCEYAGEEGRSEKREAMSILDTTDINFEVERVELWRLDSLERAGYDAESAAVLAASPEVDLHRAVSLLESGCSVDLALQILL